MDITRMAGDVWGGIEGLGRWTNDTIEQHEGFEGAGNEIGKPDDYGLRGRKANFPMGSKGSNAMVKGGILGAVAGSVIDPLAETYLKPAAEAVGGWTADRIVDGVVGLETAMTAPAAPNLPAPQVAEAPIQRPSWMPRPTMAAMGI